MANNKVVYFGETLMDLTEDTVTPETLAEGTTAHDKTGKVITGTMPTTTILYTEQALTEAQKQQARQNIGVVNFTEKDKADIVAEVIATIGTPVFGTIDAENNIILTGNLVNGTYTLKYEDSEGNATEIGSLKVSAEPQYAIDMGQYARVGGSDYRVWFDELNGQTNYKAIYQIDGDVPLPKDNAITTTSNYYPLKVPSGATKVTVTFPNLGSNKLLMYVYGMSLSEGVYTRIYNQGWGTEGVYSMTFDSGLEYIGVHFRNNGYTGLDNYDTSDFTLTWE